MIYDLRFMIYDFLNIGYFPSKLIFYRPLGLGKNKKIEGFIIYDL